MQWCPVACEVCDKLTPFQPCRCSAGAPRRHDSGFSLHQGSEASLYSDPSPCSSRQLSAADLDDNTQDSGYGSKFHLFAQSLRTTHQDLFDSSTEDSIELPDLPADVQVPMHFNELISEPLNMSVSSVRRSVSFDGTPTKRFKGPEGEDKSPGLKRAWSLRESSIKHAVQRSAVEPDLIGDFSKVCSLPLILGRHQDLKSISAGTLADVIRGGFSERHQVIDCRFPYEFEGGHIKGASNLYTREHMCELLNEGATAKNVLVFHCEFSSERGPNLCRFLRNIDRAQNKEVYPALCYPEVYVLDGGYKSFYEQHVELCEPQAYRPMLHPEHQNQLRLYKGRSKVCAENPVRLTKRVNLKRLGF